MHSPTRTIAVLHLVDTHRPAATHLSPGALVLMGAAALLLAAATQLHRPPRTPVSVGSVKPHTIGISRRRINGCTPRPPAYSYDRIRAILDGDASAPADLDRPTVEALRRIRMRLDQG